MTLGTWIGIYSAIGLSVALAASLFIRGAWTIRRFSAGAVIALLWPLIPAACVIMISLASLEADP